MNYTKKITCTLLVSSLVLSSSLPAFAAESSEKEEVVYIMTDATGTVKDVNIVNIFGSGDITDYGNYSSVKMLTSNTPIQQSGDETTFSSDENKIYYQGTCEDTTIPWNIAIEYLLDGKTYAPEELAGKSGNLTIHFTITQNKDYDGDFFDHYALQASFTLSTDCCDNIKATDATVANVGSDKQLTYTILPGKGIDTKITATVHDFEMESVSINGIALNLAIDISENEEELMEKVSDLIEATGKLHDGTNELSDGTNTLLDGSSTLSDGADSLVDGAAQLDAGIQTLQDGISTMQDGLNTLNLKSSDLVSGSAQVKAALETIQTSLNQVSMQADSLQELTDASGSIQQGISQLSSGAAALEANIGYAQYKALLSQNGVEIDTLLQGNAQAAAELESAAQTLSGMSFSEISIPDLSSLQNLLTQIGQMEGMEEAIPGYGETAAEIMNQLSTLQAQLTNMQTQMQALQTFQSQADSLNQAALLLQGNSAVIGGTEQYLNTLSASMEELTSGLETLNSQYAQFDAAIGALVSQLSDVMSNFSALSEGINTLVTQYSTLDSGIQSYTDGVAAIVAGYSQLTDGAANLASGSKSLLAGTEDLADGANELYDGIASLYDGAKELNDGTSEMYDKTSTMDTQVEDEIDRILSSLQGTDSDPVSFASEKNTKVESVQFVIKTDAVEKPEEEETVLEETETTNFWQKFINLFSF